MIYLKRTPKPTELTPKLVQELTTEFKTSGNSVWNIKFLKDALLDLSNDKCCYCEANINEESKYLEVEHFHHKDKYVNEVLDWNNLLPSCKRCNGTKNDHDTVNEPIIDPTKINPQDHLKYKNYRIKGKDDLGKLTVRTLDLNDQDRLVKKRFDIGNSIHDKLEELNELMDDVVNGIQTSTRRKNRIKKGINKLLKEGLPSSIYSASTSSIILNDEEYYELKLKMNNEQMWNSDLDDLETKLKTIAFDIN